MVVLTVGMVPVILDSTIVNVALATMARDFGAAMTTVQWVSTAYLLATAVMIPLAGWAEQRL
ncbi:MAG: MFS transporter, partial [Propionicimonas sp.]|nr:MFS transporter [Propionicimonas sp.]